VFAGDMALEGNSLRKQPRTQHARYGHGRSLDDRPEPILQEEQGGDHEQAWRPCRPKVLRFVEGAITTENTSFNNKRGHDAITNYRERNERRTVRGVFSVTSARSKLLLALFK
jgi:hypothetical protein